MSKDISPSQRLLEQGKYLITLMDGYWYIIHPPSSWIVEIFDDSIFRTGFDSDTPEAKVREFYAERLGLQPDEIVRAV